MHSRELLSAYLMSVILEISDIKITDDLFRRLSINKQIYQLLDIVLQKKSGNSFSTIHSLWNSYFLEHFNQKNGLAKRIEIFKDIFEKAESLNNEDLIFKIIQSLYLKHKELNLSTDVLEQSINIPTYLNNELRVLLLGSFMTFPYRDEGKYDKIVELCTEALEIDKNFISALINRSAAYVDLKQYSEALIDSQQILLIDFTNKSGWVNKGLSLQGLEEYSHALCCIEKALQIEPLDAESWYNKGIIYFEMGLKKYALNCYSKCSSLDPQHVSSIINMGLLHTSIKEYDIALPLLEKAEMMDPENLNCKNGIGVCYFNTGKPEEALKIFRDIVDKDPNYLEVWNNIIQCLLKNSPEQIPQVIEDARNYGIHINLTN